MRITSMGSARPSPRDGRAKDAVFALNVSGKLVHVSEVPRGKACECCCVACGSRVIAKQGNQTAWHFAHLSTADCLHAAETALHKAVKQVILEGDVIRTPDLVVEARVNVGPYVGHAKRCLKGRAVLYAGPRLEVRLGEIVADAVVTTHDRQLIIEVAVEHPVDDEKLRKLAYMQTPAIELEAWRLDRTVDWTKIRSFISESVEGRKWLFNSRAGQLMKEAQAEAQALADAHAQAARRNVTSRDMPRSQTMAGSFGRRGDDTVLTGDWQTDATTKLKRLWHRHRVDRLLTVTPSFAAADMILRWEEKDAHEGDVQSHFESLLAVLATIAHITYRDENGVIVELRQ